MTFQAWCFLGSAIFFAAAFLIVSIGGRQARDLLRAELEDARNELRHHQRGNHPAGRGLRVVRGEG